MNSLLINLYDTWLIDSSLHRLNVSLVQKTISLKLITYEVLKICTSLLNGKSYWKSDFFSLYSMYYSHPEIIRWIRLKVSSTRFTNEDVYLLSKDFLFVCFRRKGACLNFNEVRKIYGNLENINSIFFINELKIV